MNSPLSNDDSPAETSAGLPEPALAAEAVGVILKPLARLMIDHGLQLPAMLELLKKALVEEAAGTFSLADKGTSDTRIALLTGVHRKDVKRLRDESSQLGGVAPNAPIAASVVARWISEPRYLNADRSPRVLARTARRVCAGEPDFTTLVSEISTDLGARAVLDELVRLGVVELREDGMAALKATAFVPDDGHRESFHFLASNVSDHLSTAVHNLRPDRHLAPRLEQSAFSAGLSVEQAHELQQLARQLWSSALQQFLQTASIAEERSQGDSGPKKRIRFGVYFHEETQIPAGAQTTAVAPARTSKRKTRP